MHLLVYYYNYKSNHNHSCIQKTTTEQKTVATLQLNHYACCLKIFHLKRFLTFRKKEIFLEKFKFEIVFSYVYVFTF